LRRSSASGRDRQLDRVLPAEIGSRDPNPFERRIERDMVIVGRLGAGCRRYAHFRSSTVTMVTSTTDADRKASPQSTETEAQCSTGNSHTSDVLPRTAVDGTLLGLR